MGGCLVLCIAAGTALAAVTPLEVCHGLGSQTVAFSPDGEWIVMADGAEGSLAVLDGRLQPVLRFSASTRDGRQTAHALTVHVAPPRSSFVVMLADIGELWEVSYNPQAEPLFEGLVHDYRMGEGLATPGFMGVRRTQLPSVPLPPTPFYFSADYRHLVYVQQEPGGVLSHAVVVNLDVRRAIADVPLAALQPAQSALTLAWGSSTLTAYPAGAYATDGQVARVAARYCKP